MRKSPIRHKVTPKNGKPHFRGNDTASRTRQVKPSGEAYLGVKVGCLTSKKFYDENGIVHK